MTARQPRLARAYLQDPICSPLQRCGAQRTVVGADDLQPSPSISEFSSVSATSAATGNSSIYAPDGQEAALTLCVQDLHRLFISNAQPGPQAAIATLQPHVLSLFRMVCVASRGHLHLRSRLEDIVLAYLKMAEAPAVVGDWLAVATHNPTLCLWRFVPGETGGLTVCPYDGDSESYVFALPLPPTHTYILYIIYR